VRRIPKRGFNNKFALTVGEVNVGRLEARFKAGETVSPETLKEKSILKSRCDVVKVLGTGEITKPLQVHVHRISQSAQEKIEKAGGKVTLLTRSSADASALKESPKTKANKKKPPAEKK
jgi:large subunit ribosomal protein L15